MKKIKIFLASSDDLTTETLELSDLVEHLNLILEPQNIHIYLEKWDYLTSSPPTVREGAYAETLDSCEICMVVFGKDFGSYTEKELRSAYERVCKDGINPSKLYVYFKNTNDLTMDLKKFRDSFPEVFTGSPDLFTDINSLKNDFLLKFQLFQNKYLQNSSPVEVKEGKVSIYGKNLFINFNELPFVNNVTRLNEIKNSIENIDLLLSILSVEEPQYAESAEERRKLEEKKAKLETTLWDTALKISEFKEHKLSDKLKRAIELFEKGEIERILEIIDSEKLKAEAQTNIDKINEGKREVAEGYKLFAEANQKIEEATEALRNNIREFKMAIQAEELNMSDGWGDRVISLHDNVIKYTKEVYGEYSEEYIRCEFDKSSFLYLVGKYKVSIKILKELLKLTKDKFEYKILYFSAIYNELSLNQNRLKDYKNAFKNSEKALKINLKYYPENSLEIALNYNNSGEILDQLKEYHKALKYKQKALKIREEILGVNSLLTAQSYNNISVTLGYMHRYNEAIELANKALKIRNKLENRIDIANSYNNIGYLYNEIKDYNSAITCLKNSLSIRNMIFGLYNPDTANSYNNLGWSYLGINDPINAIQCFSKALEIYRKIYKDENQLVADILENLAEVYKKIGDFSKVRDCLEESSKIREHCCGENNPGLALTFQKLGFTYVCLGNFQKALNYLEISLQIREMIFGEEDIKTAKSYKMIAIIEKEIGSFVNAIINIKQAYKIFVKNKNRSEIGSSLYTWALIFQKMGKIKDAKAKFEEVIALLPEDHPEAIASKKRLKELE